MKALACAIALEVLYQESVEDFKKIKQEPRPREEFATEFIFCSALAFWNVLQEEKRIQKLLKEVLPIAETLMGMSLIPKNKLN